MRLDADWTREASGRDKKIRLSGAAAFCRAVSASESIIWYTGINLGYAAGFLCDSMLLIPKIDVIIYFIRRISVYEDDPRFPNRKRKDQQTEDFDKYLNVEVPDLTGESAEPKPLPVSGYRIVGAETEGAGDELPPPELPSVLAESAFTEEPVAINLSAAAEEPKIAAYVPVSASVPASPSTLREKLLDLIRWFVKSQTRVYAAAGVGFGILLGFAFVTISWLMSDPVGRYDLGSVTSSAAGLSGHLFIQWDKKLVYRLAIKPSDPDYQSGFALAVGSSPRPLSVELRLQNSEGFVLCSKNVLLKHNAQNVAALAEPDGSSAANANAANPLSAQLAQGTDPARLQAEETEREQGHDVFQNQIGPDGQIAALNAEGDLSCSGAAYEKATNWSFVPDFPSLAEQSELLKRQKEIEASAGRPSSAELAARKRAAAKVAAKLLAFWIEGDDSIEDFDTVHGVIQTRGRKTFYIAGATAASADSRWQDYPVNIHFRCDRSSSCELMHTGLGALRARMSR